ncbi:MAG: hypothetical protein EWV55_06440 [Microcystis viridis Mv_BB_P_19951000_S69]|jgi:hypothetical protein|uniref:Uncharacterized protein n=1 Tax=Microcystis viridis Mv_BB_P_19951000_S68D TaxID=2486270 RepID=A0A552HF26_MICVR|nr:MAG: hypothetical protein EWV77_17840 [Microcystis viridis Mv_BB_P_19951000_S68D]TRU76868.1 MAG: hypothetical protein EWV55_06440 [Microcystis viridis Mv_BB_P_19951000_S69]TRU78751.1 MAG: hypothetical protein EWV47_01410 [Microcystis viridis Mv_BB_P_19951000_S68]TRU85055.1 MAG: hypothetical protein EWV46_13290 [Microcystis viridis Mv_BB_P_19951000_S69D]
MLNNKYLKQWSCIASEHLPHLSIPQAIGLAALLNQGMNANCAGSRAKVSLALGFKNTRKEDSYLKSANQQRLIYNSH